MRLAPAAIALASALVAAPAAAQAGAPALVVLVVVDQLRPDYLVRFRPQLTGGFARLLDRGAVFLDGRQDHAITQTAPGHSTLLSGRFPAHTGIMLNDYGVPDTLATLLGGAREVGASPRRFRGTTLYDWMLAADPAARVLSVSRKDRGAILPVGRARGDVYWYGSGLFTTSRYYADTLPTWVQTYNARRGPAALAGRTWTLLLPDSAYAEPDTFAFEGDGREPSFPHVMPGAAAAAADALKGFPWMDSLTLDFALAGLRATGLGRRARPDLLVVSLSTLDELGHDYGPDSRELHDHFLRLDRWLGAFLDSLAALVPAERTLVALSADHGSMPLPEHARTLHGRAGGRVWLADIADSLRRALDRRFHTELGFDFDYGILLADTVALHARGVNVDSLARAVAAQARRRPGVRRAFTPAQLRAAAASDLDAARWRRSIPRTEGWLFATVLHDGFIYARRAGYANHGSSQALDVTVPILFAGPGVRPGRYRRVVRTVDIAPTLAALLGIRPTEPLDGHRLAEVLGPRQAETR